MKHAISLTIDRTRPHLAAGLMSGTSHDGISAALVRIDERRSPPARLIAFKTLPYSRRFRARLLEAAAGSTAGSPELSELNFALGRQLAAAVIKLAAAARVPLTRLAFIGSHGHTFFHLPPRAATRAVIPSTLQLGEPAVIAALTGVAVVAGFRPADIALGGEGAPLAPLAHLMLFGDPKRGRVIQNIGGIANATYLPPAPRAGDPRLIAFDTGPGVILLDAIVARLTHGRLKMDRHGRIAARGQVSQRMVADLMNHRYFGRPPPKSTGREQFGAGYLAAVDQCAHRYGVKDADLVATVTALTARSIADACRRFIIPVGPVDQLIAAGGGARNPALLRILSAELPETEVLTADQVGVNGDALEAIAFAILGYRMLCGLPGNIPSVTGARIPAILGNLTLPPSLKEPSLA